MTVDIQESAIKDLRSALEKKNFNVAIKIISDYDIDPNSNIDNNENILSFIVNNTNKNDTESLNNFIIELHNKGMDLEDNNFKDNLEDGLPILFTAIENNNKDLVGMLLKTNNYSRENGLLALHMICDESINLKTFLPVFSAFSEYVDDKDIYGDSVISNISSKNYEGVENKLFSLLRASNDKESINFKGQNSLFQAVETGTSYTTKLLLSVNINVNHIDRYDRNALFRIDGKNEDEIKSKLKYLVEAGINVDQLNKSNKSAFDVNEKIKDYKDWVKQIKTEMETPKDIFQSIISENSQRKRGLVR